MKRARNWLRCVGIWTEVLKIKRDYPPRNLRKEIRTLLTNSSYKIFTNTQSRRVFQLLNNSLRNDNSLDKICYKSNTKNMIRVKRTPLSDSENRFQNRNRSRRIKILQFKDLPNLIKRLKLQLQSLDHLRHRRQVLINIVINSKLLDSISINKLPKILHFNAKCRMAFIRPKLILNFLVNSLLLHQIILIRVLILRSVILSILKLS